MWKAKQKSTRHNIFIHVCAKGGGCGIARAIGKHIYENIYIFCFSDFFLYASVPYATENWIKIDRVQFTQPVFDNKKNRLVIKKDTGFFPLTNTMHGMEIPFDSNQID